MSRYELLLTLHVVAAIIWLGAGFVLAVLIFGAERAGDRVRELGYSRDIEWLATRLFIPASLSVLALGILLVVDGDWSFDQLWIVIGLAGYAASFLVGILYFKPEAARLAAMVEEHGPDYPELARRTRRVNIIDRVQVVTLFLVVADMVVKPTGDDTGILIAGGAILAAAVVFAVVSLRQPATARAPGVA